MVFENLGKRNKRLENIRYWVCVLDYSKDLKECK